MAHQDRPIQDLRMRRPEDGRRQTTGSTAERGAIAAGYPSDFVTPVAKLPPLADHLTNMNDEELRAKGDVLALQEADATWQFYDDQLRLRATERLNARMEALATETTILTRVTVRLTWVSVAIAVLALIVAVITLIAK
jgi:hypothetical protein